MKQVRPTSGGGLEAAVDNHPPTRRVSPHHKTMSWCRDKPSSPEQQVEGSQAQRLVVATSKGNVD
eukprot:5353128-Prymnesium_polylepis.1